MDIDKDGLPALASVIKGQRVDVVVHTAGPFQQRTNPTLLEASIAAGTPYVDVCDEPPLCAKSKLLHGEAVQADISAVTAAGIWPGASALMAAEAVKELRRLESDNDDKEQDELMSPCEGEKVELSFFTAGTGNAGATIVSATFLLLCQPALTFLRGSKVDAEPWTSPRDVDFGAGVGVRTVRLLDNPDVYTLHESLRIPSLSSRFATAPGIWNQLFGALKTVVPRGVLGDAALMQKVSLFSLPIIRAVDKFVGATNAMRVDAFGKKGSHVTFSVTHADLEQCVGLATAAFALELLQENENGERLEAGVFYPSDLPAKSRRAILERVKTNSILWEFRSRNKIK